MASGSTSGIPVIVATGRPPGVDAAVELADDVLVADVEALADDLVAILVVAGDDDDRAFEVGEPAEPAGEHRSQRVRHRAGHVPGGEVGDRSHVDDQRAGVDVTVRGVDVEPVELGQLRVAARSAPVQLGQPGEVGRERTEPGQQLLDEGVLVIDTEQVVGGPFPSQRRRPLGAAGSGAERAGAVGRVHRQVVGQPVEATQRVEHVVGQRLGQFRAAQIGASDGADHQRATAEQRCRRAAVLEQVDVVVGGVTGRGDRPQRHPWGECDPFLVVHGEMRRLQLGCRGCDERDGAVGGQRRAAGHVVGVGMGVDRPAHCRPRCRRCRQVRAREAGRVEDRRRPVAEVDEVRGMPQSLVDEHLDTCHQSSPQVIP